MQTDRVKRQDIISIVSASGKIEPKKKVDISASIPGKIVKLSVEEGDQVKTGDFLLQIDPVPFQAALDNSEAALTASAIAFGNSAQQPETGGAIVETKSQHVENQVGLISKDEYERARTDFEMQQSDVMSAEHEVEQAVAEVDRSKDDLNKTRVVSPMSGMVVRRAVEEGEVAVIGTMNNAGTVLLTIADLSVMEAELEVDETDIGNRPDGTESRCNGGRVSRKEIQRSKSPKSETVRSSKRQERKKRPTLK